MANEGRKKIRRGLVALVLLALVVWFAPPLIAVTPLRDKLLNLALTHGESIRSGGASLGWLSPIELTDVRLYDRDGKRLARVPLIQLERRLIDLATNPRNVGVVRLEQPEVYVALRAGGSNWEDFLAPWLVPTGEPARPVTIAIEVLDGRVLMDDTLAGRKWEATSISAGLAISADDAAPMKLFARATLSAGATSADSASADGPPGKLEVHVETGSRAADPLAPGGGGRLSLQIDAVPLDVAESLVARFVPGAKLSGNLTSNMSVAWTDGGGPMRATLQGATTVENFSLSAEALSGDRLKLARLEVAPTTLVWQNNRLAVEEFVAVCDLGRLSVQGALDTGHLSAEGALGALGAVARENYQIDAQVDLARLAAMLPGVLRVREGTTITAGTLRATLQSTAGAEGHVWQGRLETDSLAGTSGGRPLVWDRPIRLAWTAREAADGWKVDELVCQSDFLELQGGGTLRAITATAKFDLDRLADHLDRLVDLGGWRVGGQGTANLALGREPSGVFQTDVRLAVERFQITHPERLPWMEEQVELEGRARWNPQTGRLDVTDAKLTSAAATIQIEQAAWQTGEGTAPKISGTFGYDAALDQIYRWAVDPKQPAAWWPTGRVAGQVRFAHQSGTTEAHVELTGRDVQLYEHAPAAEGGSPYRLVWREPEMALAADVVYDQATDHLRIDSSQLRSGLANLSVTGTIAALAAEQQLDLAGTIEYDLERITPLVRPHVGGGMTLVGHDTATFKLRGPLTASHIDAAEPAAHWSRRLAGEAGFGWERAEIYGLPIGPGRLQVALGDGMVGMERLEVAVLDGRLIAAPTVRIDPAPMELVLPAGPLVEKARITPEVADAALKYVAPVLADATRTEGLFSIDLASARVPLADPAQAQLAGRLTIEQARIAPGPLAKEFIRLGQQIEALVRRRSPPVAGTPSDRALMTLDNQTVEFQMVDGRVYHRGLEMTIDGGVRLRTSGWVGVDQTLAILAEIPIQDRWIRDEPLLEGLRNQSLRIPIGGTLSRPQVDARALAQFSEQLVGGAVRGAVRSAITNELDKQLEKLLRRR